MEGTLVYFLQLSLGKDSSPSQSRAEVTSTQPPSPPAPFPREKGTGKFQNHGVGGGQKPVDSHQFSGLANVSILTLVKETTKTQARP